jgi:exosortase/archaeosortase family protein
LAEGHLSSAGLAPGADARGRPLPWNWNRALAPGTVLKGLLVAGLLVWAYWYPIRRWRAVWDASDAWSHGYFIPLIAVLLAHYRLQERPPRRLAPWAAGLGLVLVAAVVRIVSFTTKHGYPGEVTFVLAVAGTLLWLLGWDMFKTLWVSAAYLVLMVPWEQKYYESVALPLQRASAMATELFLRVIGYQSVDPELLKAWLADPAKWAIWVSRIDNVLYIPSMGEQGLMVAGPCSGLHLLFAFVALGVLMAFVDRRTWWERLVIVVSSLPIAVFCNFVRVTLMAVASDRLYFAREAMVGGEGTWLSALGLSAEQAEGARQAILDPESFTHQSFGYAMLGLAFLLMWLELKAIGSLFISEEGPPAQSGARGAALRGGSPCATSRRTSRKSEGAEQLARQEGRRESPRRPPSEIRNTVRAWAWVGAALLVGLAGLAVLTTVKGARAAASARAEAASSGQPPPAVSPPPGPSLEAEGRGPAALRVESPSATLRGGSPCATSAAKRRAGRLVRQTVFDAVAAAAALVGAAAILAGLAGGPDRRDLWVVAVVPVAYLAMNTSWRGLTREPVAVAAFAAAAGLAVVYGRLLSRLGARLQYWACVGALGAVAGFFQFWEPPPPKPVPIRQSLRDHFPRELGAWRGEFRALEPATEKELGADDYLNLDLREAANGRHGLVFVTYSANAMSNIPHVPWVCMTQAGYLLKRMDQRDVLVRALGNKEFRVNVAYFEPKPQVPGPPALMLQYFNVGGTYTTSREIARFLGTTGSIGQQGSYLSQTQVAVWLEEKRGEDPMAKTSDAYQAALGLLEQVAVVLETAFYPDLGAPEGR